MNETARLTLFINGLLFVGAHVASVTGVLIHGVRPSWIAFTVMAYCVQVFGITAGYHRYFSHRSYKTGRTFQLVLALMGAIAGQRGALWWAGHHRHHHLHADLPEDVHSPEFRGFLWAHVGWILSGRYATTRLRTVRDLARFPELCWLNRYHVLPPLAFILAAGLVGGIGLACWGLLSMILAYHAIFSTNSVTHLWGTRRYNTGDRSTNNALVAIFSFGEGWHNNHHRYPPSARVGFTWWEIDISFYILKLLERCGLVWALHTPPATILAQAGRDGNRTTA